MDKTIYLDTVSFQLLFDLFFFILLYCQYFTESLIFRGRKLF